MHAEVIEFLRSRIVQSLPHAGAHVVEVGAQDVNGATRDALGWRDRCTWHGIDLVDGPDVDYVGDAATVLRTLRADGYLFDGAVSTEVLEHAADWRDIVMEMALCVRLPGWLVVTCAGPGRPPHGASGGDVAPVEHYENVHWSGVVAAVLEARPDARVDVLHGGSLPTWPQDTQVVIALTERS